MLEERFPSPSIKMLCEEEKFGEKAVVHIYQHSQAAGLVTASSPAPGGTMRTWQDIFADKVADMHLEEPWILQEDNTLQVHILKPGWKEFVQRHALGRQGAAGLVPSGAGPGTMGCHMDLSLSQSLLVANSF